MKCVQLITFAHYIAALVLLGAAINQLHDMNPFKRRSLVEVMRMVLTVLAWGMVAIGAVGVAALPFLDPQDHPTVSDHLGMVGFALLLILRSVRYRYTPEGNDAKPDSTSTVRAG